FIGGF
ncbi:hypothetical protein VCHENC02_4977B, partial [Vibrio harveyi]